MDSDGFELVTSKKGRSRRCHHATPTKTTFSDDSNDVDVDKFVRQIEAAVLEFDGSDFFRSFVETLTETDVSSEISRIVCLGIGNFCSDRCSRHQLTFLVTLSRHLQIPKQLVLVYDPKFSQSEKEVLRRLEFSVEAKNEEGKYETIETCLFYFPHCPKHLTNNLLWSNWSPESLSKVVLVSNSFERITTSLPERILREEGLEFILRARDVVVETAVKNNFVVGDVFNDTSLHRFLESALVGKSLSAKFWVRGPEPVYLQPDAEFVRK